MVAVAARIDTAKVAFLSWFSALVCIRCNGRRGLYERVSVGGLRALLLASVVLFNLKCVSRGSGVNGRLGSRFRNVGSSRVCKRSGRSRFCSSACFEEVLQLCFLAPVLDGLILVYRMVLDWRVGMVDPCLSA